MPLIEVCWAVTSEPWVGLSDSLVENLAARWKGLPEISEWGDYQFKLEADTGAILCINDA